MKIIKIYAQGSVPSKKNQRITNRKTGRSFPSKRYTEWHKHCSEQYKENFGNFPTQPIRKCYKIVTEIVFGDLRRSDTSNKIESINDFLVDIGVLYDDNWMVTGKTEQEPSYEKNMPHWVVTLWVDERNPINKLVNWDEFNVVDVNNTYPSTKGFSLYESVLKRQLESDEKKKKEELRKKWS